jgi:O-acetyl-ADP-ribose deacetylase (regulator of RNase III)
MDILKSDANIICHQVNCHGVMGRGLAKAIKNKYPKVYENYRRICKQYESKKQSLLGQVVWGMITPDDKIIANLFGELDYGGDGKRYTDYNALESAFKEVYRAVTSKNSTIKGMTIAIPYNIGCGLGGGDWNVVYKIIEKVFKDYDITICKI